MIPIDEAVNLSPRTSGISSPAVAKVPFNRASAAGNELRYMAQALATGQISGDHSYTKKCKSFLEKVTGAQSSLLVTSCTHALEMAALLLNIQPNDEVIVPSFTFVSTANAFVLRGARPVFADISPTTLNIDESHLESLITDRTRAIVPVHYAGVGCEMEAILDIAARHNLAVIEDNAHGLFGTYKGKPLGSFGALATQSFHETKNITCGEGGALLVNDERLVERAEIIREKGTNRAMFFRGQVDKYSWVDIGSSYIISDVLAAFLYAQLEQAQLIQSRRRDLWVRYDKELAPWAERENVRLPAVPGHCEQSYHMFYVLMPSLEERCRLIEYLKSFGVSSAFHYVPLHLSAVGRRFGGKPGDCKIVENVSDRLLRLPFYTDMTTAEQGYVIDLVNKFKCL